jgi:hypothetical protein
MKQGYDACMDAGRRGLWINTDGSQRRGSSHAIHFWHGFNGVKTVYANPDDRDYRRTIGYAFYCAGVDFAKESNNA